MSIVICLFFHFYFRLQQSGFHEIVNNGVISRVIRKWKRSDFSDSNSIALMTPLTTLIFDFHYVISTLYAFAYDSIQFNSLFHTIYDIYTSVRRKENKVADK